MVDNALHAQTERMIGKVHAIFDPEERRVLQRMKEGRPVSRDAGAVADEDASFGERLADRAAAIGGSWTFIICFSIVLLAWMMLNSNVLAHWHWEFDPYPYIFLNLMLSTLAAVQAPMIMMSQNRQAAKDRVVARLDFEVNLRTELELMRLHEKVDLAVAAKLDEILAALRRDNADGATPAPEAR